MSELDLIILQQRLQVIDHYMCIFGIGFLEALWMEANPVQIPTEYEAPRHTHCRSVVRLIHE